jgi:hypothetical protein
MPCVRDTNLRRKRHDFINRIIAETCLISQTLDGCAALRDFPCGFFAASFLASRRFLCKQATVAGLAPPQRHAFAISMDGRLIRRS